MYGELFEVLGLKRVVWEVKAYEPLPDLGERFDLVTAFSICFNGHKRTDLWTSKEWAFFLNDLEKRFLQTGGEIFLGMNPEEDGSFYTPALKQFFIERGAQIDRSKVWFTKLAVNALVQLRLAVCRWRLAAGDSKSLAPHISPVSPISRIRDAAPRGVLGDIGPATHAWSRTTARTKSTCKLQNRKLPTANCKPPTRSFCFTNEPKPSLIKG